MKNEFSKKNEINERDLQGVIRQFVIWYSPVIILFLDQIEKGQFDEKIIFALIVSTTIEIIRRAIRGVQNNS